MTRTLRASESLERVCTLSSLLLCRDVCDMIAFRAVTLGVVADEPEFVGDAGGERAEVGDGDRGGG